MGKYRRAAKSAGIDPRLLKALVKQESGGDPNAHSPAGALGETQLMPATAAALGVNPRNDAQNLAGGAKYLRQQLDRFGGDVSKALAAYNAGPGAVAKYGGVPPYAETQNYVKNILASFKGGSPLIPKSTTPSAPDLSGISPDLTSTPHLDVAGYRKAARDALLANFVAKNNPRSLLLRTGVLSTREPSISDFMTETSSRAGPAQTAAPSVSSPTGGAAAFKDIFERAVSVNNQHKPYQWGGGHGAAPTLQGPWDCSGAVSAILGVNPRVAKEFTRWGAPGPGKDVTIYANGGHTLMEINGHFFGTSETNPGGGAGWIKRKDISPGYLANFVRRHPPGL